MRQDGCTEFISASLGGGIAHISPLCYTESEIPAALRAVGHTAVFRTRFRREKEGERIRAAKRHIEPDTARHPTARISKPYPRKGTETHFSFFVPPSERIRFQNHIPARGRKHELDRFHFHLKNSFQNHIPARGRKLPHSPLASIGDQNFKTISPQGDGNIKSHGNGTHFNHFKTISPQGDGNRLGICYSLARHIISKPYPRKGTETRRAKHGI